MPFGLGNADDISSTGMLYADPHSELVHRSWNSETLPIVSKQKWTSFAFPLPDSYLLRLEQLFPSTIYIIGHGCCAVVGESAVCRYYIYMAFLWRHNIYNMNSTSHQSPVQTNHTTTLLIFVESFQKTFFGCQKLHHCIHLNPRFTRWCREYIQSTSPKSRSLPSHGGPRPLLKSPEKQRHLWKEGYVNAAKRVEMKKMKL